MWLGRLWDLVDEGEGGEGMLEYACNEKVYMRIKRSAAVCMALDFSLRLGRREDDEGVRKLLAIITEAEDWEGIAKSRSAWRLLKNGCMGENWSEGEDVVSQFEKLRDALAERAEKGVQRPFQNLSMRELVERLDRNTIKHDNDEDQEHIELEELRKQVFMGKRSIVHPPASASDIEELEHKLDVQLPADYREFLGLSNGLEGIWKGLFRQRDLGRTDTVQRPDLSWMANGPGMPISLVDWTELPIEVEWPIFDDPRHVISIHDREDEVSTWLVHPPLVQATVEKFVAYDSEAVDEEKRKQTEKVISAYFGSLEEFREMEWCVVTWVHWTSFFMHRRLFGSSWRCRFWRARGEWDEASWCASHR